MIRKMGRYALINKLGQGSMGVVYKAHDEVLGKDVALKTMAGDMDSSTTLRSRFYQEARLAANLNHPNIVRVFDLGEIDGQIYIAMELLHGSDLRSRIQETPPPPLEQRLAWMVQIAEALAFAHRAGIIHRDIKPANIHIRESGEAVIMDFGIARAGESKITKGRNIIGSPEYVAPEQIVGGQVDQRADIFSLGVVLYELLTLQHPFRANDMATTIQRVINDTPAPAIQLNQHLSNHLNDVIMKALEKNPSARYQNCEDLLHELQGCRAELSNKAKELVIEKDRIDSDILDCIGHMRDLYPANDYIRICRDVGYDPTIGFLPQYLTPETVTLLQASELLADAQRRLTLVRNFIETAPQMESIMQAGKAFFAANRYPECIEQMNVYLAYYPDHELASEYIKQAESRLNDIRNADRDRLASLELEQQRLTASHSWWRRLLFWRKSP